MPIVPILQSTLFKRLGREYSDEEFEQLCFDYGLELDEITSEEDLAAREKGSEKAKGFSSEIIYKVEVPANRHDLLCPEGLTRALMIFNQEIEVPVYNLTKVDSPIRMFIKPSTQQVRPYVVGAILRNIKLDKSRLESFIGLQDKLHQNICRKRSLVAIGTHDLDKLQPPFFYHALPPSKICFVPLNQTKAYTGDQLMELYSTDSHLKAYLPIIRDKTMYPVIMDSADTVLSMPPIINGEHSRVTTETRNIFIEATATDLHKASIVLDTIVTIYSEYCDQPFTVEPVQVIGPNNHSQLFPRLDYRDEVISVDYVNGILGTDLAADEVAHLLHRMGLITTGSKDTTTCSSGLLSVRIPPTRHDILHACDIAEDVAIAYGFDHIPERPLKTYCIAKSQPLNRLSDLIRVEIAHAGFTEVLSFSLCSRDDVSTRLRLEMGSVDAVHISNPKSSDFQVVRTSLLPGILHTLSNNRSLPLPLKLFEVQDVVVKDSAKDVGARNNRRVCAIYYNKHSGFEVIHGLLDRLMKLLDVEWHRAAKSSLTEGDSASSSESTKMTYQLKASEDPTYFTGRCADVILNPGNRVIGRLGVLHPEVVRNFELTMPCSVLDIDLEVFS